MPISFLYPLITDLEPIPGFFYDFASLGKPSRSLVHFQKFFKRPLTEDGI